MSELLPAPPRSVVVLKLSALGDVCHTLPVMRTLQRAWPAGALHLDHRAREAGLVERDFKTSSSSSSTSVPAWRYRAVLRRALRDRRIDLLLHMQFAWRASLVAAHRSRAP